MLSIKDLNFTYSGAKQPSLRQLSLQIETGALFGLLGPNGAGKTTLLSIIAGLIQANSGTINFEKNVSQKDIALVPQDFAFYQRLTIRENLHFFSGLLNRDKPCARQSIDNAIQICQLEKHLTKTPLQLSGGLKRRLNLAIGLLASPKILLLDEPTVGIDPQSRRFILDSVADINAQGTTVIYTSHYMEEVERICDSVAIVDHGQVQTVAKIHELCKPVLAVCLSRQLKRAELEQLGLDFTVDKNNSHRYTQTCEDYHQGINTLAQLKKLELNIKEISYGQGQLEELFMQLTSTELRD